MTDQVATNGHSEGGDEIAKMLADRLSGMSYASIAKKYHRAKGTVARLISDANKAGSNKPEGAAPSRSVGKKRKATKERSFVSDEEAQGMRADRAKGMSLGQLVKKYGRAQATIWRALNGASRAADTARVANQALESMKLEENLWMVTRGNEKIVCPSRQEAVQAYKAMKPQRATRNEVRLWREVKTRVEIVFED